MTVAELLPPRVRGPCKSETLGKEVGEGRTGGFAGSQGKVGTAGKGPRPLPEETRVAAGLFSSPLLSRRRVEHFTDLSLSEEAIPCNGLPILSVAFNKEALLVSNPSSASTEPCSYLSELVLFFPPRAPRLHQCTLALTLSQPLEGDLFPIRKGDWERFQRP